MKQGSTPWEGAKILNCDIIRIMAYKDKDDPRSKEAKRRHYERNRDQYKEQAKQKKRELRDLVRSIKESSPCADCNVSYPYWVMHFDHVDDNKVGNVSRMINNGGKAKVLEEIAKCDLVCSNCHATRTYARIHNMPLSSMG